MADGSERMYSPAPKSTENTGLQRALENELASMLVMNIKVSTSGLQCDNNVERGKAERVAINPERKIIKHLPH